MKEHLIDINDLTDSRELLMAHPPRVMTIFIYALIALFVVAFAWVWFGEIDIVIKAPGIIRPSQTISVVRNITGGDIKEKQYTQGTAVKKGDLLYTVDDGTFKIELQSLLTQQADLTRRQDDLTLLERSIIEQVNYFTDDNIEYYNRYLVYQFQLENLTMQYRKAKNEYERNANLPGGSISKLKLEELEANVRYTELNMQKYISEYRVTLKTELQQCEKHILQCNNQIKKLEKQINFCRIKAPIDGVIQEVYRINPGDYLTAGIEVLKIIPGTANRVKVELMIDNKDIANVNTDYQVQYRFASLPQNEYGTIKGTIVKIPGDITTNTATGESVYVVEGSLDKTSLNKKTGEPVAVKIGMFCDARIIVSKQKILHYLLKKLDFLT